MAKGRTRWSRAILASRLSRLKLPKEVKKAMNELVNRKQESQRRLLVVQKKVRVLNLLTSGCRKLSLPNLVEEANDYILALEMQVRTMSVLAELLAGVVPP
ncbi:hypothetical protein Lalb_Chr04g0260401 [Lupinus albus]|uniref:Transcription factor bHLH family n=1 Tax=Lupinus albus TaxID=3870 RepID=A0A6A4QNH3_LUPAL|nr:hypothetical protein Lalb_Chr04g0260401 [Lupinus albus]